MKTEHPLRPVYFTARNAKGFSHFDLRQFWDLKMSTAFTHHPPSLLELQLQDGIKMDDVGEKSVHLRRADFTSPIISGSCFCYVGHDHPLLSCKHCKEKTAVIFPRPFFPFELLQNNILYRSTLAPFKKKQGRFYSFD